MDNWIRQIIAGCTKLHFPRAAKKELQQPATAQFCFL